MSSSRSLYPSGSGCRSVSYTHLIIIATATNNLAKGLYFYGFADRRTGLQTLALLVALTLLGFVPLIW